MNEKDPTLELPKFLTASTDEEIKKFCALYNKVAKLWKQPRPGHSFFHSLKYFSISHSINAAKANLAEDQAAIWALLEQMRKNPKSSTVTSFDVDDLLGNWEQTRRWVRRGSASSFLIGLALIIPSAHFMGLALDHLNPPALTIAGVLCGAFLMSVSVASMLFYLMSLSTDSPQAKFECVEELLEHAKQLSQGAVDQFTSVELKEIVALTDLEQNSDSAHSKTVFLQTDQSKDVVKEGLDNVDSSKNGVEHKV